MTAGDVEERIAGFLAKYAPPIEACLADARGRLRARFPRGYELVFDNYNALVFGISPSEKTSGSFVSVAGYPRWVTLFFLDGAALDNPVDDPRALLVGDGKRVRGIRLADATTIDDPPVAALIDRATAPHRAAFAAAPPLTTIVRTVVATQRPRRPA